MPPLFITTPRLYTIIREISRRRLPFIYLNLFAQREHRDTLEALPFKDHVVLCGYGRVGRYIGRALTLLDLPFVVVEYNQQLVRELQQKGITAVYGDPSDIDILDFAQVDTAKAVVVTIPDLETQELVIANCKRLNKNIQIYVRTHHEHHQPLLKKMGVVSIVQPEFEASLAITRKLLDSFGHSEEAISKKITRLKIEHGQLAS